jgi:hypothetical protein
VGEAGLPGRDPQALHENAECGLWPVWRYARGRYAPASPTASPRFTSSSSAAPAAYRCRRIEVLAEPDRLAVHHPNPAALQPGGAVGYGVDQHGRLARRQQPLQHSLAEQVVDGDQHKQPSPATAGSTAASDAPLPSRQRSAYTARTRPAPRGRRRSRPARRRGRRPPGPAPARRPAGSARPARPGSGRRAAKGLGAAPGDGVEALGPAAANTTPTRVSRAGCGLGRAAPTRVANGSGGSCAASAMCHSASPTKVNSEGTVQGSPVTPTPGKARTRKSASSRGCRVSQGETRLTLWRSVFILLNGARCST